MQSWKASRESTAETGQSNHPWNGYRARRKPLTYSDGWFPHEERIRIAEWTSQEASTPVTIEHTKCGWCKNEGPDNKRNHARPTYDSWPSEIRNVPMGRCPGEGL